MELYFRILDRLSTNGIGNIVDISDLFDDYLVVPPDAGLAIWGDRHTLIIEYLDKIAANHHIKHTSVLIKSDTPNMWVKKIKITAEITDRGLDYYNTYVVKEATLKSFKNQNLQAYITWGIAVASLALSIYLAVTNNSLEGRVRGLEKSLKKPISYPQRNLDSIRKNPVIVKKKL